MGHTHRVHVGAELIHHTIGSGVFQTEPALISKNAGGSSPSTVHMLLDVKLLEEACR